MYNILKTKLFLFKGFFAHFVLSAAKKRRQPDAMINLWLLFMWLIKHMLDLLSSVLHFSWRTFKGVFVMKEIDRVARGEKLLFDHSTRVASCNTFPPMNAVQQWMQYNILYRSSKKTSQKLRNCPKSKYSRYSRILKFGRIVKFGQPPISLVWKGLNS